MSDPDSHPPYREESGRGRVVTPTRLLAVICVVSLALLSIGVSIRAHRKAARIKHFSQLGAQVSTVAADPVWLHDLVVKTSGQRYAIWFEDLNALNLQDIPVAEGSLDLLGSLDETEIVNLQRINLENTRVTDAALQSLRDLRNLERLVLENTHITDAGIHHLGSLSKLRSLNLESTLVTDAGLPQLSHLTDLLELSLNGTAVTDEGLQHLIGLGNLQWLDLLGTRVSEAGVERLQSHLPGVDVWK